ncbi:MAG: excinuclease ABC subunit UvrC [Candidatus Dadabacteria bacterium]|nr:excinuclease ABC subunit UvrC [Candidatus Dadabacteria bacterium]MDE0520236.1 excinuclease ABC subunit UvrC [Candidatus Dadabacteria bacterium]MDE0663846.1 excinuclease ABC subunit UvrC [Candidatus Dadabacteria bacterium]
MREKILELSESFPSTTGVYIMKGAGGTPVYIGKAKNLRTRVMSYFQGESDRGQIPYLVREVDSIDYVVTEGESEALFIENSLIKRHKPKYNIRLKDDKTFSSLRLSVGEKFPRLSRTRRIRDDGALYFGPFASGKFLKSTVNLVHRLFPLRDCTQSKFERHSTRPCLNYFMKLCSGPCAGRISDEDYGELVKQATSFLRGEKSKLVRMIREMMERASEEGRYENAAYYRDQLVSLKENAEIERSTSSRFEDMDVVGFYRDSENYEFTVLLSRGGSVVDKLDFSVKSPHGDEAECVREFLGRFYFSDHYVPKRVLLPASIRDREGYSEWLTGKRGKRVYVEVPVRGPKSELVRFAMKNARESFSRKAEEKARQGTLLRSIRKSAGIKRVPYTIECFDISNIQGQHTVASLVRFRNARVERDRYRRYRITTPSGPDDFRSMYEVVYRRARRAEEKDWDLPDLILIDGGKGQLNAAHFALRDCGVENEVDLASIAKTEGRAGIDRIYLHGKGEPCDFSSNKKGVYFLMRVRDEAHRFAVTYHRELRKGKALTSQMDGVPGIGKKRKLLLLNHFGSVEKIKGATAEELASIKGMTKQAARNVKEFLR